MADYIKHIALFSDESIAVALNSALDDAGRELFVDKLRVIAELLEKPAKKQKKQKRVSVSAVKTFREKVLPQIEGKLREYQAMEDGGADMIWDAKLEYNADFSKLDVHGLIDTHKQILIQEENVQNLKLVVAFHRGLLYMTTRAHVPTEEDVKVWYAKMFVVQYPTVLRYMTFACIIKRYPRLIVCGLSFTQIMKHQRRLVKHLEQHSELAEKLANTVILSAQDTAVDISPSDTCSIPDVAFSADPDYAYEDDSMEDVEDPLWDEWLQQECESGGICEIIRGKEQEEMEDTMTELCGRLKLA